MGPTYRERAGLASLVGLLSCSLASCCFTPTPPLEEEQVGPSGEPIEPPGPPPVVPTLVEALRHAEARTPQRPDAPAMFAGAQPVDGAIHRGLLLCRAEVRGSFDDQVAGAADVAMSLQLGAGPPARTWESPSLVFSFPVQDLAVGTWMTITLVDRDVLYDDFIAHAALSYERAPFEAHHRNADLECRALPSVEARAEGALERYRQALASFTLTTPDLEAEDLGFPSAEPVVRAAEDAASWLGWQSPELAAGREQAARLDLEFAASIGREVARVASELPPVGVPIPADDLSVRLTGIVCGEGTPACTIVLELTARRATSLYPFAHSATAHEAWTLGESGRSELAERLGTRCGDRWIRAAEELAVAQSCEVHLGVSRAERLLRVGAGLLSEPILLRLE